MSSGYSPIKKYFIIVLICFLASIVFAEESEQTVATAEKKIEDNPDPKNKKTFDSVEERRLYTILQNERESLEEEKKVLALKEKELKTLEQEADKKLKLLDEELKQLKKVKRQIDDLLAEKDIREVQKVKDLSLIYAKMSPDRAALAMSSLDLQLAADIIASMKVKSAAKILDKMDKARASQLSTVFTTIQVE